MDQKMPIRVATRFKALAPVDLEGAEEQTQSQKPDLDADRVGAGFAVGQGQERWSRSLWDAIKWQVSGGSLLVSIDTHTYISSLPPATLFVASLCLSLVGFK